MEHEILPADTRMGRVRLRTRDAGRLAAFYRDVLGLVPVEAAQNRTGLGAAPDGPPLVVLEEEPAAPPRPPAATGLYHLALRVPDRPALGRVLLRLRERAWPIQGAADHAVSEAVYLADPDGNGVELYADRPRDAWTTEQGQLYMTTAPLDVAGVLAAAEGRGGAGLPAGTAMGHVHLRVEDLAATERFYHELIGFQVMNRAFPGALFVAAGGYHHHLGLNTWGAPMPGPEGAVGLVDYAVVVPAAAARALLDRLEAAGVEPEPVDGGWRVWDPSRNGVVIQALDG